MDMQLSESTATIINGTLVTIPEFTADLDKYISASRRPDITYAVAMCNDQGG